MAGLLGFIGLLTLSSLSYSDATRRDIESSCARTGAEYLKKEIYYDGFRRPHWTETNEIVEIIDFQGYRTIQGVKSKKIYKEIKPQYRIEEDLREEKFNKGIDFCKNNNLKYFPFYFPNTLSGREKDFCTGIEVESGKKYCCFKRVDEYILLYLEDKPHTYWQERGGYLKEYDAIHDEEGLSFKDGYSVNTRREKNKRNTWYLTKKIYITEKDYLERTTELSDYPYEYYVMR